MLSFTGLQTRAKKLVSDDTSANGTFMAELINETQKIICGLYDWSFLEDTFTATTTASQQIVKLPVDYNRLITYKLTVGGIDYTPNEIADYETFDRFNYSGTSETSDYPVYFHIRKGQLLNYPAISSAGNTLTIDYYKMPVDMTGEDYTTGTITTLAAAGTTVTGSGTTWTAAMVGRYIKITSNGQWYKIATRTSNTEITIDKPYEGTAIAAGSEAYTIADLPVIPEEFQDLLYYRPAGIYFMMKGDESRSKYYFSGDDRDPGLFERRLIQMKKRLASKTAKNVEQDSISVLSPNYNSRTVTIT
jgi:hypothetical protein